MSYLEAVEKHNKKKVKKHKKNAFINMTEEPKLTRQKLILQDIPVFQTEEQEKKRQQTHDEFLREQMKKGADEEVMTDGLFTKFVGGKDFFTDDTKQKDMVNHPEHYNQYEIECIDAIKAATGDGFEPYLQGNILKYLWRYNYKNGIEDLKKAQWYLSKLIEVKNGNKS